MVLIHSRALKSLMREGGKEERREPAETGPGVGPLALSSQGCQAGLGSTGIIPPTHCTEEEVQPPKAEAAPRPHGGLSSPQGLPHLGSPSAFIASKVLMVEGDGHRGWRQRHQSSTPLTALQVTQCRQPPVLTHPLPTCSGEFQLQATALLMLSKATTIIFQIQGVTFPQIN